MMDLIISILVLCLSFLMFVLPSSKKLGLILFSCICLESFSFSYVSFGACNKMLCLFYFLSELKNCNIYIQALKGSIIGNLLLLCIVGTIFLAIYSSHAHNVQTLTGLFVNDLIAKYFVIAYIFVAFKHTYTLKRFYKIVTIAIVILTIFGILNILTKNAVIADLTGKSGTEFAQMHRTRVVSMFSYAFDYGFCCCVLSIFALYGKRMSVISKIRFYIILSCSLFGVIICGCRSVIVVEAIMLMIYVFMMYRPLKSITILCTLFLLLVLSYSTVPSVKEKIDTVATAFNSENQEMGESSLFMRALQFTTVLYQIHGHELSGRGYRFFIEDLGYDSRGNGFKDMPKNAQYLMGLEGVSMNLLLERGYIGLGIYIIFYGGLIICAYNLRKRTRPESACAISVILGFVCYGNMTGELSSAIITLLFSGLYFKLSKLRGQTQILTNSQSKALNNEKLACNSNSCI